MDKFCRAARRTFTEVVLLQKQHIVSTRRRVESATHAGCAAADDDDVPGLGAFADSCDVFVAVHLRQDCYAELARSEMDPTAQRWNALENFLKRIDNRCDE